MPKTLWSTLQSRGARGGSFTWCWRRPTACRALIRWHQLPGWLGAARGVLLRTLRWGPVQEAEAQLRQLGTGLLVCCAVHAVQFWGRDWHDRQRLRERHAGIKAQRKGQAQHERCRAARLCSRCARAVLQPISSSQSVHRRSRCACCMHGCDWQGTEEKCGTQRAAHLIVCQVRRESHRQGRIQAQALHC